jgi:hypothetical protein
MGKHTLQGKASSPPPLLLVDIFGLAQAVRSSDISRLNQWGRARGIFGWYCRDQGRENIANNFRWLWLWSGEVGGGALGKQSFER